MSKVKMISDYGQSIWLDYIDRQLLSTGMLSRLIEQDGISGVTSNPAIFQKAIGTDPSYADAIQALARQGFTAEAIYEQLAISDIREAADQLLPVYEQSHQRDGYVSLEVSPKLARDTAATVSEARRLWAAVDRQNLMIKVPATDEGLPAITQLISQGINVNVTLLFSPTMYRKVADAYLAGLEHLSGKQASLQGVASVASFFVSRIDTAIEKVASGLLKGRNDAGKKGGLKRLLGKVAVANAKAAYTQYLEIFSGPRWGDLAGRGAEPQRLLWASTGTKNPAYSDVLYIEELIGPDTVNTAPPATINAFRDHGHVRPSLQEGLHEAHAVLRQLEAEGIALEEVSSQLLDNGIKLFDEAFDGLIDTIAATASIHSPQQEASR